MRKLIFITASVLAMLAFSSGRITAADEEQTFLGSGRVHYENNWQKVPGSMLRVYGYVVANCGLDRCDQMFKMFQITNSTSILDSNGKATDPGHSARCDSLEVTYTGKKEPYVAVKVECLTDQAFYLKDPRYFGERDRQESYENHKHKAWADDLVDQRRRQQIQADDRKRQDNPNQWVMEVAEQRKRDRKDLDEFKAKVYAEGRVPRDQADDEAKAKADEKADAAEEKALQQVVRSARAKAGAAPAQADEQAKADARRLADKQAKKQQEADAKQQAAEDRAQQKREQQQDAEQRRQAPQAQDQDDDNGGGKQQQAPQTENQDDGGGGN